MNPHAILILKIAAAAIVATLVLGVWAACCAAGDADRAHEDVEQEALEANRRRLRALRKDASGTRP